MINKKNILAKIIAKLSEELASLTRATEDAHAAATHEETQAKSKYDTFAVEASYLAQGQAKRATELEVALESFKKLEIKSFNSETPIALSALVLLQKESGKPHWIFLSPDAGGTKISEAGKEITAVTTKSPLGRALVGAKQGDAVETDQNDAAIEYEILEVL